MFAPSSSPICVHDAFDPIFPVASKAARLRWRARVIPFVPGSSRGLLPMGVQAAAIDAQDLCELAFVDRTDGGTDPAPQLRSLLFASWGSPPRDFFST